MGSGRAHRDPTVFGPCHGGAIGKLVVDELQRLAAVGGARRGGTGVGRLAIVAADDHAMTAIAKGDREDAGGFDAGPDRRIADLPVLTAILGTKDARDFGAARREPDV